MSESDKLVAERFGAGVLAALSEADRPESFVALGDLPPIHPGLEVDGLGVIGLPLTDAQAPALIAACRQAPYGKGTETLVDTTVRKVWELDGERVGFSNPAWEHYLGGVVREVEAGLGLSDDSLTATLYKLLVYEEGGFFLPHQDGERLPRMVATLVLVLPSAHQGGELIVRHQGEEVVLHFDDEPAWSMQYAAFYTDCPHEVRPVTSGRRLCLTYNLTLTGSADDISGAPDFGNAEALAKRELQRIAAACPEAPIFVALDHEYTEAGFSPDTLKGADRSKAAVLAAAAAAAGYDSYLTLATLHVCADAHSDDYDYYYTSRRSGGGNVDDVEMGDVIDESFTLSHWFSLGGKTVNGMHLPLLEEELITAVPMRDLEPEKEFEGYTGNAGMTLDYWYRSAVVTLLPKGAAKYKDLLERSSWLACGALIFEVEQWQADGSSEDERRELIAAVKAIFRHWWRHREDAAKRYGFQPLPVACCAAVAALADRELAETYLRLLADDLAAAPDEGLVAIGEQMEWGTFTACLGPWFAAVTEPSITGKTAVLETLCQESRDCGDAAAAAGRDLMRIGLQAICKWAKQPRATEWRYRPDVSTEALLATLFRIVWQHGASEDAKRLTSLLGENPLRLPVYPEQVKAARELAPWLRQHDVPEFRPFLAQWVGRLAAYLLERTANKPKAPTDFARQGAPNGCCQDCNALSTFLANPDQRVARFSMATHRRDHLHQVIETHGLDTTHVTERSGRPYTLVCTKTTNSYKRKLAIHNDDCRLADAIVEGYDWLDRGDHG